MLRVSQNDYPTLKNGIIEYYVSRKSGEFISQFVKNQQKHGSTIATKNLLDGLSTVIQSVASVQGQISYSDLNAVGNQYNKLFFGIEND